MRVPISGIYANIRIFPGVCIYPNMFDALAAAALYILAL
jgi:hypothetical protein